MTRFTFTLVVLVSFLLTAKSGGNEAPNLEKTLEAQMRLISERPYQAEVHNDLGNLLVLAGRFEEAEAAYKRALELDPLDTAAGFNLGLLLQQSGRSKEALVAFKAVMAVDPNHAWATYQAGAVLHERGKRKEAMEHYAHAFALDSSLTFANTNPHLIDNGLATEALLMSEKYTAPASTRTPRLYGQPERIVNLMLQTEEAESAASPAVRAEADEKTSQTTQEQQRKRRPRPLEQAEDVGEPEQRQGSPVRSGDEGGDGGSRRAESVQVVGGALVGPGNGGEAETDSGRNTRRGTPGRGATVNSNRAGSGRAAARENLQRQEPNRARYRPATTSTGRLELELLPEGEEPERAAR